MWYEFSLTVPAGTTEKSPVTLDMPLSHGIIHLVHVEGATGMHRMVHLRILHKLHQVYPTNPEGTIRLDSVPRIFQERYELLEEPYRLQAVGWAPDTTYDHDYRIGFGVLPPSAFPEYQEERSKLAKFFALVGIR